MPSVLVTGAGRGLGLEFVRQYAAEGWDVVACLRNPSAAAQLQSLVVDFPGRIEVHALDVADFAAIDALAAKLDGRAVDVLLNVAGTMGKGNFAKQGLLPFGFGKSDYTEWEQIFRINAFAPMKMAEAFIGHVSRSVQRKIVSLTTVLASIGQNNLGGMYSYRASKAALNAIMRSMAIDLARRHGIAATTMHPGWARTDMGGPRGEIDAATSVRGMRAVIEELTLDRAGRFWMYDGTEIPW